jgi:hypothetical protein
MRSLADTAHILAQTSSNAVVTENILREMEKLITFYKLVVPQAAAGRLKVRPTQIKHSCASAQQIANEKKASPVQEPKQSRALAMSRCLTTELVAPLSGRLVKSNTVSLSQYPRR